MFVNDTILYLCRSEVEEACRRIESVEIIRGVFKRHGTGQTILPDEAYLCWRNGCDEPVRSLNMPGYVGGSPDIAGTKIINSNISNPAHGLPRASGVTLLFDPTTVQVVCIMEGAYISSVRTASTTALAAEMLAVSPVHCIALIGAGVLAQAHIELLVRTLPHVQQIRLFDIDNARAAQLQKAVASQLQEHNIALQVMTTAKEAITPAQLIIPATTTTTGYIAYDWLQPGATMVNVSLDDPLPEVVNKADKVIVDDWNLVKNDRRRLIGRMYHAGQVIGPDDPAETAQGKARRIDAELGDIVAGRKAGRESNQEIILVNPFGLAIEDIALAAQVYAVAQELGLGRRLLR
jgi:N-[(2S)-2-amino-2-carboxyethyl]-L-glutamate dehydrogenase